MIAAGETKVVINEFMKFSRKQFGVKFSERVQLCMHAYIFRFYSFCALYISLFQKSSINLKK